MKLKTLGDPAKQPRRFNLSRWFAALASLTIGGAALIVAFLLAALFAERMVTRDSQLTANFIDAVTRVEVADSPFEGRGNAADALPYFAHIAALGDTVRINAYSRDGVVVWSTDGAIIGRRFDGNAELARAIEGEMVVHAGKASRHPKPEHVALRSTGGPFVENYIPVRSADRARVIGVIEVYRVPEELFDAIDAGRQLIWAGAALAAVSLVLILTWAVRRADRTLARQREQLLEAQTLATVGELSRAVAHSVRNPLAAIRSAAELELHAEPAPAARTAESMEDVIGLVDRIDRLLSDMLSYARPGGTDAPAGVDLARVVQRTLENFALELKRNRIEVRAALPDALPAVTGDERLLGQALASVMSNAVEAMPEGGRIDVTGAVSGDCRAVHLAVRDTGIGMSTDQVERAFDPFYTNKARGLGIGLALVKRIVERSRGQIRLSSRPGHGTTVDLTFRTAGGEHR